MYHLIFSILHVVRSWTIFAISIDNEVKTLACEDVNKVDIWKKETPTLHVEQNIVGTSMFSPK